MKNRLVRILFFLALFLLLWQWLGKTTPAEKTGDEVILTSKGKVTVGKEVTIKIENRGEKPLAIPNPCPQNPFLVEWYQNGEWIPRQATLKNAALCKDQKELSVPAQGKISFSFSPWNRELFGEVGQYRLSYETGLDGKTKTYSENLEITEPNLFQKAWRAALYQPILNVLFWLISIIPGHSLGWAIVLLTVLIRLILVAPNQKALKSQKALQQIQPQLDALKQKHKDNPQLLAEETMKIWKANKVNPVGSCLPILIQFPILISLFYVIREGLNVDPTMLYGSLKNFDPALVNAHFAGLDLTKINVWGLPIAIALLQFIQIKMSLGKASKAGGAQAAIMGKMMQFVLPVMVGVFAAGVPAAVALYWGISTLFSIDQQAVVNRSKQ